MVFPTNKPKKNKPYWSSKSTTSPSNLPIATFRHLSFPNKQGNDWSDHEFREGILRTHGACCSRFGCASK